MKVQGANRFRTGCLAVLTACALLSVAAFAVFLARQHQLARASTWTFEEKQQFADFASAHIAQPGWILKRTEIRDGGRDVFGSPDPSGAAGAVEYAVQSPTDVLAAPDKIMRRLIDSGYGKAEGSRCESSREAEAVGRVCSFSNGMYVAGSSANRNTPYPTVTFQVPLSEFRQIVKGQI